jgi:putative acetyltransferase
MQIRPETSQDVKIIEEITKAAFANHPYSHQSEHKIVQMLRDEEALSLSLVAELGGQVVGHIAFSRILINDQDMGWYGIGPMSVKPEVQRQGVGSALINRGLEIMREAGAHGCVLVGDPNYYWRFGFRNHTPLTLPDVSPENFLVLSFSEEIPSGTVVFHKAFKI